MKILQAVLAELIEELDGLSFYRYVPLYERESIKRTSLDTGKLFCDLFRWSEKQEVGGGDTIDLEAPDATKRAYTVDVENIQEAGISVFMRECAPLLETMGVSLGQVREVQGGEGMVLEFETRDTGHKVLTLARDAYHSRESCLKNSLVALNEVLGRSNCEERVFETDDAGDSRWIVVLTPRMYEAISLREGGLHRPGIIRSSWIGGD